MTDLILRRCSLSFVVLLILAACFDLPAQTTGRREVAAMTFQSGREFQIPLTGTPRFPKLRGDIKVKYTQRTGSRVELKVNELPAVLTLGGLYMSYVVWTIGSDGRAENVGTLKTSFRGTNDSGVEFPTSLSTFGIIVSAEPFAKVRRPGPMVILESNPQASQDRNSIVRSSVWYDVNQSDFYRDDQMVGSSEKAYRKQRPELLRADRARMYAQYAGADNLAPELYKRIVEKLESLKNDVEKDLNDRIIEQKLLELEDLAAGAEAEAEKVRSTRLQQRAEQRRQNEQKKIEDQLSFCDSMNNDLRKQLDAEKEERAASTRRADDTRIRYDALEKEYNAAVDELKTLKAKFAQSEADRVIAEKRLKTLADLPMIRDHLRAWFTVTDLNGGIGLKIPETLWRRASAEIEPGQLGKLEPGFRRIANWSEFRVVVSIKGSGPTIAEVAEERFRSLSFQLQQLGIEPARITFEGPASEPVVDSKPSAKPAVWTKTEIRLELVRAGDSKQIS
jgi:hypothetical protein